MELKYERVYIGSVLQILSRIFFAVQPKILPIPALTNLLREGMRAAISCQILEGDLPVAFRWEKNGQPVTSSPYAPSGIITRRMDEYSASLVIEQITSLHSGNYTCIASNVAGSERYTVPLTVNGKTFSIIVFLLYIISRYCFCCNSKTSECYAI